MSALLVLVILVVVFSLAFDYTNGFHDSANAVATVVSTGVLPLRTAVVMAGILNAAGAFVSTRVAETIAGGLVQPAAATDLVVLAAVVGAITWNIITWWFGIPSSSSHALIGGLVGATLVAAGSAMVIWRGLLDKVVIPLVASPVAGFLIGLVLMAVVFAMVRGMTAQRVDRLFRHLQVVTAALMAFAHGANDAQKSMGIITIALVSAKMLSVATVPDWVIIACAGAMGLGTMAGGVRIIHTMGEKIIKLQPINGFAAEASAAGVIFGTAMLGMPISTTHVIAGSIFGVGLAKSMHGHEAAREETATMVTQVLRRPPSAAVKRREIERERQRAETWRAQVTQKMSKAELDAAAGIFPPDDEDRVHWDVARQMAIAWVLTLPAAGLVGAGTYSILRAILGMA
jgi:PiT family inorganic phosphate transporter